MDGIIEMINEICKRKALKYTSKNCMYIFKIFYMLEWVVSL